MPKPFATAQRTSSLYSTARWKQARATHLELEPWCRECRLEGRYVQANTVDHDPPHRGNETAFWDHRRFVSLCTTHHNSKTGRETKERLPSRRRAPEQHPGLVTHG